MDHNHYITIHDLNHITTINLRRMLRSILMIMMQYNLSVLQLQQDSECHVCLEGQERPPPLPLYLNLHCLRILLSMQTKFNRANFRHWEWFCIHWWNPQYYTAGLQLFTLLVSQDDGWCCSTWILWSFWWSWIASLARWRLDQVLAVRAYGSDGDCIPEPDAKGSKKLWKDVVQKSRTMP